MPNRFEKLPSGILRPGRLVPPSTHIITGAELAVTTLGYRINAFGLTAIRQTIGVMVADINVSPPAPPAIFLSYVYPTVHVGEQLPTGGLFLFEAPVSEIFLSWKGLAGSGHCLLTMYREDQLKSGARIQ